MFGAARLSTRIGVGGTRDHTLSIGALLVGVTGFATTIAILGIVRDIDAFSCTFNGTEGALANALYTCLTAEAGFSTGTAVTLV